MLRKWDSSRWVLALYAVVSVLFLAAPSILRAQANSGMIQGTVTDPQERP